MIEYQMDINHESGLLKTRCVLHEDACDFDEYMDAVEAALPGERVTIWEVDTETNNKSIVRTGVAK